jgi:hypothetical protein
MANKDPKFEKMDTMPSLNVCQKCGALHGMVLEDTKTGKTEPLDLCKNCMFYGTHIPLKEQVILKDENILQMDVEYMQEQMDRITQHIFREYMKDWLLYGNGETYPEISQEMHEMYAKAYVAAEKQWEEAELDQRFVEVKLIYDPPLSIEDRWKRMIEGLKDSQKAYNQLNEAIQEGNERMAKSAANHVNLCNQGNPSGFVSTCSAEQVDKPPPNP